MWPQALQMTRDECRGILRRLELESYSQVISVFRAQGGLTEAKAKLLEDLRAIFHISNERHRAEARRVANDEQLATIAEAISGPNTWQEWSREGRRPYPLLPRVAPQTALALIANAVAEEVGSENAKLPYPAETGEAAKEEHQQQLDRQMTADSHERNNVVTSEPFKVPKIPSGNKKNLKRNLNEQQNAHSGGKKRVTNDNSPQKNHHNAHKQQYPHITANSPQANSTNASGHERKQQLTNAQQQQSHQQHLQKQRYFHHQQQLTKQKMAKRAAASASTGSATTPTTGASTKRQATPAKSGRRANQKHIGEQQQPKMALKQLQNAEKHSAPAQVDALVSASLATGTSAPVSLTQQQLDLQFVAYTTQNQPPQQIFTDEQQTLALPQNSTQASLVHAICPNTSNTNLLTSLITPLPSSSSTPLPNTPQIAASKRDVSKNLNKLQQMQQNQLQTTLTPLAPSAASTSPGVTSQELQASIGSILSSTPISAKPLEKSLISTTPVQKYIVEERPPGVNIPTSVGSIVNLQNTASGSPTVTSIIQVSSAGNTQPQIMTLPQFSAAATKLRAVNTTLIAPGAKMSPTANSKKHTTLSPTVHSSINAGALHELANVASTQSQVLQAVEQQPPSSNTTTNNSPSFNAPLHPPPAIIQIQNSSQATVMTSEASVSTSATGATQSKVLTTKILPLVLASTNNQTGATNSPIIITGSPTTSAGLTSTMTTSTGTTLIKNLPSTVVLNTSTSNLTPVTVTGNIFSTLGAGATVFRKPPNIIKSSTASGNANVTKSPTSATNSPISSGAPNIISNVKLTPINVTSSGMVSPLNTTTTFKNVLPSTSGGMMRTSVKICQSPNGKVVIQPAGLLDSSKIKTLPHKILTNPAPSVLTTPSSGVGVSGGQRIAIQKVQIIPAPMGSPAGANALQAGGNTKTSPLAGKSNMIFMPSSASANVRPVTLSKMGTNLLLKSSAVNAQITGASDNNAGKSNIVVLGPTTSLKDHPKLEANNSFMSEDNAPLDILNMPIVMDPGVGGVTSASGTVTVLSSNLLENNNATSCANTSSPIIVEQGPIGSQHSAQQTVILGATDWEMELDQAITTAAHNNNHAQSKPTQKQKRTISTSSSTSNSSISLSSITGSGVNTKTKRVNNDLISIELKTKGSAASTVPLNSLNNIIVVDSLDDVIVEEHEDDLVSGTPIPERQVTSTSMEAGDAKPKILDMQIYQQHDSGNGNKKSKISIVSNNQQQQMTMQTMPKAQQMTIQAASDASARHVQQAQIIQLSPLTGAEVNNESIEHQQQQRTTECEVDAGFDETIAAAKFHR